MGDFLRLQNVADTDFIYLKLNSFSFLVFCEYIYKVLYLRYFKIKFNRYNSC